MEFKIRAFRAGSSLFVITDIHQIEDYCFRQTSNLRCASLGKQMWQCIQWCIKSFVTLSTLDVKFLHLLLCRGYDDAYILMEFEAKFSWPSYFSRNGHNINTVAPEHACLYSDWDKKSWFAKSIWSLKFAFPRLVEKSRSKQAEAWQKALSSSCRNTLFTPSSCTAGMNNQPEGMLFDLQRKWFPLLHYPPPFTPFYYLKFYRLLKIILVQRLKISQEPQHFAFPTHRPWCSLAV